MKHLERYFEKTLVSRLKAPPRFIQVILGPRQVGKTSGILNLLKKSFVASQYHYASAEESLANPDWFLQQLILSQQKKCKIVVFDEIQKLDGWSELVKQRWDQQRREKKMVHWVLLGSSSLKLSQGLGDSLAGRFEVVPVFHWNLAESLKISKMTFDEYLTFGGYPGSYPLLKTKKRLNTYLFDSIIESVISKDILRYASVKKPALFRQTFALACQYPAQEVSYNKLLGQLQEAGNVDQIKYYLDLFTQAYLIRLVFKWSATHKSRTSSPKILPCAPVFSSLFHTGKHSEEQRGRVFEAIVGNRLCESFEKVYYWHEGNYELDFVIEHEGQAYGVEVKSAARKSTSLTAFRSRFSRAKICIIDMKSYPKFEKNPALYLEENSV